MGQTLWHQIDDAPTQRAVKLLDRKLSSAIDDIATLQATPVGGGGITLPIAMSDVTGLVTALAGKAAASHTHVESDVTGLVADLAAKVPTSRTISTTAPLSGGGDLSADRTLVVADNSTSSKGVVAQAPNDTSQVWRGDASWGTPVLELSGFFGTGESGDLDFDGVNSVIILNNDGTTLTTLTVSTVTIHGTAGQKLYTLNTDIHASNITIASGVWLNTGGYRIFCSGTFTLNGRVGCWGSDGGDSVNGTNVGGAGGAARPSFICGGSSAGGTGGTTAGGLGATGAANTNVARGATTGAASGTGGTLQGGKGGTRGDGSGGGAGGSISLAAASTGPFTANLWGAIVPRTITTNTAVMGGSGGGGGSGGVVAGGGGGGGGGGGAGVSVICALTFAGSGVVDMTGGYGGNASTEVDDTAGGGGGGGGGCAIVVIGKGAFPTVDVSGGLHGAASPGNGSGNKAGFDGGPGMFFPFRLG